MDQKVCHAEYRIVVVLTDHNINDFAVLFRYHTVDGKWKGYPLPFFDTAVVVGIEICKSVVLIQRVLFYIETRGIDVCAEDVHTFGQRSCSDLEQCDGFFHAYGVNFVAWF